MKNHIEMAKELKNQGLSYSQIGEELGISKSQAYRLLTDFNGIKNTISTS